MSDESRDQVTALALERNRVRSAARGGRRSRPASAGCAAGALVPPVFRPSGTVQTASNYSQKEVRVWEVWQTEIYRCGS